MIGAGMDGVRHPGAPADVEISIVSLGDTEMLAGCTETLAAACSGLSWRLSIVDNSPHGQNLERVLSTSSESSVLRRAGPRGFGANHNLNLERVLAECRARYVLVLNDDTKLDRQAVTKLVVHADTDASLGALCPEIRDPDGGLEPSRLQWPSPWQQVLRTAVPRRQARTEPEHGWLNGACMLLRTAALRQVGLFDDAFFLFFEDTDLCRRLEDAGWGLETNPDASIVHFGHGTILAPERRPDIEQQLLRSRYLYFRKHHGPIIAHTVTMLVRGALLARTVKMLAEAAAGRRPSGFSRARTLWALARNRPTRPSRLELEARDQSLL
jgi:GT2 family glycosyltransferase